MAARVALVLLGLLAAVSAQTLPLINLDLSKVFKPKPPGFALPGTPVISGITDVLTCNVQYQGGPVLPNNPKVYYIFYGSTWNNDPAGKLYLINLAKSIGGSPYYNIQTTYYQTDITGTPTYIQNAVTYGKSVNMPESTFGTALTNQNILEIVNEVVTNTSAPYYIAPDANAVYFVLTAADIRNVEGFCTAFCGYHTANVFAGQILKYSFVGNAGSQCPGSCIAQTTSISGSVGADGMASVLAHELVEATSDPELNAWYDCQGEENADKCAWTFGTTYTTSSGAQANMKLGGQDYLIQQNWVHQNGLLGSFTSGCALKY